LVQLARDRGGYDNITAVAVTVCEFPPRETAPTAVEVDELRATGLFEFATTRELQLVCAIAEHRAFATGEVVLRETAPCGEMYLVRKGRVELCRRGRVLDVLAPGAVFGEGVFFDPPGKRVTARVLDETRLIVLARHRLDQLMRQDDALATRILWGLLRRVSTQPSPA
jgi:CRP-like cAMP-binding protein